MPGRATFKPGAKVQRIEERLDRPTVALKKIGALMVSESQRAFKMQRFGRSKWQPRGPVNVFGILADFARGAPKPADRRFDTQPALVDTGTLRRSIASQLVGTHVVEVGTNLRYAAVHQKGGTSESAKITREMQSAIWKWLKGPGRRWKTQLGWLLNRKFTDTRLTTEVPKREFIGITDYTRKAVRHTLAVEIMEAE